MSEFTAEELARDLRRALGLLAAARGERDALSAAVDDALAAGHCGWSGDRLACLVEHCATGHRDRVALREEVARLREALDAMAAWGQGDVGPHMDEPCAAERARAALAPREGADHAGRT